MCNPCSGATRASEVPELPSHATKAPATRPPALFSCACQFFLGNCATTLCATTVQQCTRGFHDANMPLGFARCVHTCSAHTPNTSFCEKDWPKRRGAAEVFGIAAYGIMNSTPTRLC